MSKCNLGVIEIEGPGMEKISYNYFVFYNTNSSDSS